MKKLRLSIDDLAVDTFRVDSSEVDPGTVLGHDSGDCDVAAITGWSWLCGSCAATCDGGHTCALSCGGDAPTACMGRFCQKHPTTDTIVAIPVTDPMQPVDPANPVGGV